MSAHAALDLGSPSPRFHPARTSQPSSAEHGRSTPDAIRVVACSEAVRRELPRHARARHAIAHVAPQDAPAARSIQGSSYGLTAGERAVAAGAGILFAAAALSAILV